MAIKFTATYFCDSCGLEIPDPSKARIYVDIDGNFFFHDTKCFKNWSEQSFRTQKWGAPLTSVIFGDLVKNMFDEEE